ncbi:MAG: hypothetical protein DCF32_06875 [Leptolyngbya sp.]|nr:MAG: hypothetical protein DCF32_06875 [Leptolyngbya sp.]
MNWRRHGNWLWAGLLIALLVQVIGLGGDALVVAKRPNMVYAQMTELADPIELRSQGQTLALEGRCAEAIPLFTQALELYQAASNDPTTSPLQRDSNQISEAMIFTHLSSCHLRMGNYEALIVSLSAGLETRRQLADQAYLTAEAQAGLGPLADWLDTWRNRLASDTERITALDQSRDFFNQLMRVLAELGDPEGALVAAEKGRARAIADLLTAGLGDLPSERVTIAQAPTLAEIRRIAQGQSATLVEYAVVASEASEENELYSWVVKPTGDIELAIVPLAEAGKSLQATIERSRVALGERLRGGFELAEPQAPVQEAQLRELYQLLIVPIQAWLPEGEDDLIVFIPQDELFLVPFPALLDGGNQPLIRHHTLSTAPSIQVLGLTEQRRSQLGNRGPITGNEVLLVGNPTMPEGLSLRPLPGAGDEVDEIAPLYGNAEPLKGTAATETTVKQRLPAARLIHLATHGLLEAIGDSGIPGAIALAPDDQNDGLLTSAEIFPLSLQAELVVLSACDTGLGTLTGDGVVGLARSFFQAGVASVIVSLWAVPDAPTAKLMAEFYRQLPHGQGQAQALRQAMLTTLQSYPNPEDWAAFSLVGAAK